MSFNLQNALGAESLNRREGPPSMGEALEASGSEEVSLNKKFSHCEDVIEKLESGMYNTKDLQVIQLYHFKDV